MKRWWRVEVEGDADVYGPRVESVLAVGPERAALDFGEAVRFEGVATVLVRPEVGTTGEVPDDARPDRFELRGRKVVQWHVEPLPAPCAAGEWSRVPRRFDWVDAEGEGWDRGGYVLRDAAGRVRALVGTGSGTRYNVAHVYDERGAMTHGAELNVDDDGIDPEDPSMQVERAWCESVLAEAGA